jgi:hypothetical protein
MSKKENQTRNPKQKKEEKPDWKTRLKNRTDKGKQKNGSGSNPTRGVRCRVDTDLVGI